ncbi:PNPOx family protein [Novosphingobium huizhouense]|uniref:pyridoxamine 5'-phosphate oxidase family protein n=1 Tax=Novosphingobium huizhouense TaxID=2866625 RepID=UPI001CD8F8C9|nr:pyridoxamine 5'-phosphate oxidase family protein [Novosphingobium huizhouense]
MVETTDALPAEVYRQLAAAVASRRHAMHAPVVAGGDGDARVMVLRGVDPALAALRFHTDARAPKVAALGVDPRVTVLGYDPAARVQMRLKGVARIEREGDAADAAWAATSTMGRRCYLALRAPGVAAATPGASLPEALAARRPTTAETAAGRLNFAVLLVSVLTIDWLRLDSRGGTRAVLQRAEPGAPWHGGWVAP